jgi:hypothetical protein
VPSIRVPFTLTARAESDSAALPLDPPALGVTTFDKQFEGEVLVATSVVRMVSVTGGEGPLAYVALERVEGSLDGRTGAFALRHIGSLVDGKPVLELLVVPGSGTGALAGIRGQGTIEHTQLGPVLELDYELG